MMEEVVLSTEKDLDSYDSFDDEDYEPPKERWAPLGAAAPPPEQASLLNHEDGRSSEREKLRMLEDEQEQLNSSLLALTSHFAQVQFRLKQIVDAPTEEKENLLKDLEEFAFKGIPDFSPRSLKSSSDSDERDEADFNSKISEQRQKQQELIAKLKTQLEELETYAYETGSHSLPTSRVIEKQDAIIDQLKNKLGISLDDFDRLNNEDLRRVIDQAIGQIVNPARVKEKVVEQLKTQIVDLERFIQFLQGEAQAPIPASSQECTCPVHSKLNTKAVKNSNDSKNDQKAGWQSLQKTLTLVQLFIVTQFGCGTRDFKRNLLKKTMKGNHWGDLRANLELAIDKVVRLQTDAEQKQPIDTDYASDSEDAPVIQCNQALVTAVRKELAMCLRDLLQHGLLSELGPNNRDSLVPLGCFPKRHPMPTQDDAVHIWDLFLKYYDMKHGKEYNELPVRKLSQAFSLNMVGGRAVTTKQTLLGAIEEIVSTHRPLKRSNDSQFKAFVCLAVNQRKMVSWLHLLLRSSSLIEHYYQPWSYVIKTGANDTLHSLDRLSKLTFNLPMDLAIRPFNNISDAF